MFNRSRADNLARLAMRACLNVRQSCALLFFLAFSATFPDRILAQSALNPGFAESDSRHSPSERAGREIWFNATAFNDRFYTYAYPQRLGATIDWYLILGAKNKRDLFQGWGAVPDPDCCVPGDQDCPKKSLDETYGFQWCRGDDELLKYVGKEGYRDPACDFLDSPFKTTTPHGSVDQRQNSCDLKFGTSTGALGLRKFPNPRFDAKKWIDLNGSLASWEGYRKFLSDDKKRADSRANRLFDGSIEPPFRIGMACGACHISYDPLKPPANPNNPKWENIDGLVGNQFSRVSQMLASGMSEHEYEWQLIALSRPGTVDTSALPMDTVSNPGTMNAIINVPKRPTQEHRVLKWRKTANCPPATTSACWCEPNKPGKCWERREKKEIVPNILKGGEDSIGINEAVQRVYFNIGSCAEQCWLNHVPDLRAIDPAQRNYGQTPLDIGQCRRDCASFRAIEDRLDDVVDFLKTARPADLWKARGHSNPAELDAELNYEFGPESAALGQQVFARSCAGCHSSQKGVSDVTDFRAVDSNNPNDPIRVDFLSSDKPILVSRIGTYAGRALHSNHMQGRVWEQYAALDLFERPADPTLKEIMKGGGRGYYRPTSLLSVWAYAPFMHNNAVGPEVCGKPNNVLLDFYHSPYVDQAGKLIANPPNCWPFDPSVQGRWKLFRASMEELLYPDRRISKMFITSDEIIIDVAPKLKIGDIEFGGLSLRIPKGFPAVMLNSLRSKDLIQDVLLIKRDPVQLEAKYKSLLTPAQFEELSAGLLKLRNKLVSQPDYLVVDMDPVENEFIQKYYSNLLSYIENSGHRFGEKLSDREKQALIAFLATL
jgi:hypothetical protein